MIKGQYSLAPETKPKSKTKPDSEQRIKVKEHTRGQAKVKGYERRVLVVGEDVANQPHIRDF